MESKYLGKPTNYPSNYSPELLLPILRFENRENYGIPKNPVFFGVDVWHAYEFSFLTKKGLPVNGILKIVYPSSNLFIVESKSLKLYLNSFNMSCFGDSKQQGLEIILKIIKTDLSAILETDVELNYFDNNTESYFDFDDYAQLETLTNTEFNEFNENPDLLQIDISNQQDIKIYTDVLRSNCKVTHQPDWGSVFIELKSEKALNLNSLYKYLVSFRNENHFHEEICEIIYTRLFNLLNPVKLVVSCIYSRRGGIDICPVRSNKTEFLPKNIINKKQLEKKLLRQ